MSEASTTNKRCVCGSDAIEPELLAPGQPGYGTHYSRLVCCDCERFNGWGKDPAVTAKTEERQAKIAVLLKSPAISQWERSFLQSISRQRHLTPKQDETLGRIIAKIKP